VSPPPRWSDHRTWPPPGAFGQLPPTPEIFDLIQSYENARDAEMFEVSNMGVGFCVIVDDSEANLALEILQNHRREGWVIGAVVEDESKGVEIARPRLIGHGKQFRTL
jgi:phosphoribosylaminoimidazole (AIR) synthetase